MLSGPRGVADDLKKLAHVSPTIEKKLNDLGIFHYWQIAGLGPDAAHKIGEEVGLPGRMEGWIAQSKELTRRVIRDRRCRGPSAPARRARKSHGRYGGNAVTDKGIFTDGQRHHTRWSRSCANGPARA